MGAWEPRGCYGGCCQGPNDHRGTPVLQDCKIIWIQPSASGDGRLQTALEKAQRRIREGSSLGVCLGARLPAPRTGGLGCERGTWTGAGGRVARRRSTRGAGRAASLRTRLFQRSPRLALSRGHIFVPEAGSPLPPTLAPTLFSFCFFSGLASFYCICFLLHMHSH